jgi:hypothetical protein
MTFLKTPILLFVVSILWLPSAVSAARGGTDNIRLDAFYNGPLAVTGEEYAIRGRIAYIGTGTFNSIQLNWQVNDSQVHSTYFENLGINPYIPFHYESDSPFIPENDGNYELKVWFTALNGAEADEAASDTLHVPIMACNYLPARELSLLESFSSINCGSCALVTPVLNNLVRNNKEQFALIYYHPLHYENSPLFQFNPKDQTTRREVYGVTYTPVSAIGSLYFGGSEEISQELLLMEYEKPSAFTLEGTYYIEDGVLYAQLTSQCFADLPEKDLRLMTVVVEDSVSFASAPGSNGEKDFYFVMRAFLPDANGTFLYQQIPGATETVQLLYALDEETINPEKLRVLAFVQDMTTLDIHQTVRLQYQEPDATNTPDAFTHPKIRVYPNPSDGRFKLSVPPGETIENIWMFDLSGKQVYSRQFLGAGTNGSLILNAAHLPPGVYILQVQTSNHTIRQKISITP